MAVISDFSKRHFRHFSRSDPFAVSLGALGANAPEIKAKLSSFPLSQTRMQNAKMKMRKVMTGDKAAEQSDAFPFETSFQRNVLIIIARILIANPLFARFLVISIIFFGD